MAIPAYILGGLSGYVARITRDNALFVSALPPNPNDLSREVVQRRQLYREYFTNSAGSTDMTVDGSSTEQLFNVSASQTALIAIQCLMFQLEDANMDVTQVGELRRFGTAATAPGLTNGILLDAVQTAKTTNLFNEAGVKTLGDFMRYAGGGGMPASQGYANFPNGVSTGVDIFNVQVCFEAPLILYPGTADYLRITIRDDLTAVDSFTVTAVGYQDVL